jgi:hypothetical protein
MESGELKIEEWRLSAYVAARTVLGEALTLRNASLGMPLACSWGGGQLGA